MAVVCVTTIAVPGDILIGGHQLEAALPTITQTLGCYPNACCYWLTVSGTKINVPGYQLMSRDGTL